MNLLPELKNIVNSYIGYRVEYTDGTVEKRYGRRLDYDKKRRGKLVRITGCFDYFIDEKELFTNCINLIELPKNVMLIGDCSKMFEGCKKFNGDLSRWDVSNVTNMDGMFYESEFNGDISEWDVSSVINMSWIFTVSKFNGDLSGWDVGSVTNMLGMFCNSKFNNDISNWDVSQVTDMSNMFLYSNFNGNISRWDTSSVTNMVMMFFESKCVIPEWYRE